VHGLGDDDLVVSRAQLEELQGLLYCLQAAIEDVDADLAAGGRTGPSSAEVRSALDWLLDNARPLAAVWVEPKAALPEIDST
jgi:hypothetical protein